MAARIYVIPVSNPSAAGTAIGSEVMGLPGARLLQWFLMPAVLRLAQLSHADEPTVRASPERLPGLLDHVDRLIAGGPIPRGLPTVS